MASYTGKDKRIKYLFENGGGGGGGGTDVEANPQGTPTAYLNTIKIASSIYSVEKPADIYSTEERQVGVWIDGRPIYKRTYDLGSDVSVSYNSWTTLSNVIIPNLDFIVKGYGTNVGGTYTPLQTTWVVSTHAIQIQTPRNGYAQNVRYFTIFYCKDNDAAGSGIWTPQGSYAKHYSFDEHIIGTWADGKPLYEITIDGGALPSATSKSITTPANIKRIIDFEGVAYTGTDEDRPLPFAANNNNDIRVDRAAGTLRIVTFATWTNYSFYLTIRYTKTTD